MSQFYDKGLKFTCTQCSNCCRHDPGYVFLSENDLIRIAEHLELTPEETVSRFCVTVQVGAQLSMLSIREKPNNDCIFWNQHGCMIYDARPVQCRTYPFWASMLQDQSAWEAEMKNCPGIGTGKYWSRDEIAGMLKKRKENTPMMHQ